MSREWASFLGLQVWPNPRIFWLGVQHNNCLAVLPLCDQTDADFTTFFFLCRTRLFKSTDSYTRRSASFESWKSWTSDNICLRFVFSIGPIWKNQQSNLIETELMLQTTNLFIQGYVPVLYSIRKQFDGAPLTWCCSVDQIYFLVLVLLKLLLNHFPQTPQSNGSHTISLIPPDSCAQRTVNGDQSNAMDSGVFSHPFVWFAL